MIIQDAVNGGNELYDWFGYWPDFHDAEILRLHLNRSGKSVLDMHAWEITKDTDECGYYFLRKHVVVTFILEGITDLNITGFSKQNVISRLDIEKKDDGFLLSLSPCYGLAGTIEAGNLSIQLTPGKPNAA